MENNTPPQRLLPGSHPSVGAEAISSHHRTGGSTMNPRTGEHTDRGWAVTAIPEASHVSEHPPTPEEHSAFTALHADTLSSHPQLHVGSYHDPRTNLHHLELVAVTPHKSSALDLASSLGEDHIHDLSSHELVHTGAQRPDFFSHSPEERLSLLHKSAPVSSSYHGIHYSNSQLDTIEGGRRGMPDPKKGSAGAEASRLRLGTQTKLGPDAPPGFYVYDAHHLPDPAMGMRPHAHHVQGNYAFASTDHEEFAKAHDSAFHHALLNGADSKTAHGLGMNAGEHALKDAGYDGYFNARMPHSKFLYGDHKVDRHEYVSPSEGSDKVK